MYLPEWPLGISVAPRLSVVLAESSGPEGKVELPLVATVSSCVSFSSGRWLQIFSSATWTSDREGSVGGRHSLEFPHFILSFGWHRPVEGYDKPPPDRIGHDSRFHTDYGAIVSRHWSSELRVVLCSVRNFKFRFGMKRCST